MKGGIGLHSSCGACVCLITLRLSSLYLFFYEEKRLFYVYFSNQRSEQANFEVTQKTFQGDSMLETF
tara:strand:+ start:337 stop:537 length:201 start_codon:yes stop_codon:yes gene_type:complete